ncbi:MAG: hypothetical protein WBA11_11165, partial [Rubrivirga sp.]
LLHSLAIVTEEEEAYPFLSSATRSGKEYAWPLADIPGIVDAAEAAGLANLGGQPQFLYPDGTCEPYWIEVGSEDQRKGEAWSDYVRRSAVEVRAAFERVQSETDFEAEARQWEFLAAKLDRGEDVLPYLRFVLYFASDPAV